MIKEKAINIEITEGMVYDAVKRYAKDVLQVVKSRQKEPGGETYNDRTGNLRSSLTYRILRNGECVDDERIKPLRDKPMKNAKYSVVLLRGMEAYELDKPSQPIREIQDDRNVTKINMKR